MLATTFENRPANLVGVQLLVASLARHCPDLAVRVVCPVATPELGRWLSRYPQATLARGHLRRVDGPKPKPAALLDGLDLGHDEVLWIDADIIVNADPRTLVAGLTPATLAMAQEMHWAPLQGGVHRAVGWGLEPARALPWTANSCFIRATPAHRPLLERWAELLNSPRWQAAQQLPFQQRPPHITGDQDVLNALLSSREFADVPLHYLRRGRDILHWCGPSGFTVRERLGTLWRGGNLPALVHSQVIRPWNHATGWQRLGLELSPYTALAREYGAELGEAAPWLEPRTFTARALDALAGGRPVLRDLPLAVVQTLGRTLKRWAGRYSFGAAGRAARAADRRFHGSPAAAPAAPGRWAGECA